MDDRGRRPQADPVGPQTLLLPRRHRLAARDNLGLGDLDGLTLVVLPADRAHRRALERALLDGEVSWTVAAEVDGWDLLTRVPIDALLTALAAHGRPMDTARLDRLVTSVDKQRLETRDGRIRAAQGHSIPIDLDLPRATPPDVLYHGTIDRFLHRIRAEGLRTMGRHPSQVAHHDILCPHRRPVPVIPRCRQCRQG